MKRRLLLVLAMALLLALSITGCSAPKAPVGAIPVQEVRFKYRGNMIWLYRDADDKVQMLRGNTRDISTVTRGNKELFLAGKGQSATLANISKDQLIYVQNKLVAAGETKQIVSKPDYVLWVQLEEIKAKVPQVKTAEELVALTAEFQSELLVDKNPIATITMDSGAKIMLELYPEVAPNTVNNFVYLISQKYYDGISFHRISPGFVIQGGDPLGNGGGGPGYTIPGEFSSNGFANALQHTRGVLSMARSDDPNSAGSQFFIMVADAAHLDGKYAAFGKVVSGMAEADRIVNLPREGERPLKLPIMQQVTIETFGATYPLPLGAMNK